MKKMLHSLGFMLLLATIIIPQTGCGLKPGEEQEAVSKENDDETAVKAAVEDFLVALGDGDIEKVRTMFLPNANIASILVKNGKEELHTTSAEQYFAGRENGESRKFREPVNKYTVNISQGLLAFVRADATVIVDDIPSHHTQDFFILMKDQGVWKFLSGSYTTEALENGN